jgi:hypothetical protein
MANTGTPEEQEVSVIETPLRQPVEPEVLTGPEDDGEEEGREDAAPGDED